MRHQFKPSLQSKGFVLLQALWVLLLATLLVSIAMALGLSRAKDGEVDATVFKSEVAAESALQIVLFDLLSNGSRSKWLAHAEVRDVELNDVHYGVTVQLTDGLVDLNSADDVTLRRLLIAVSRDDVGKMTADIKAARPISSYSGLEAVDGLNQESLAVLRPHITLFSGREVPVAEDATQWLIDALGLKPSSSGVIWDASGSSIAGKTIRICVFPLGDAQSKRALSTEIVITGRKDQPYLTYDWSWYARQSH